jgi:hypothetical protein
VQDLKIIAEDGNTYGLFGATSPIKTVFLDGAGVPPVRRILEKSPLQHGALDRGFRYDTRKMTLQLLLHDLSLAQVDNLRDTLAKIFSSTETALKLRATRDDGGVRQIDCYLDGFMDFAMTEQLGASQKVSIPLVAPDPLWYNPTQQSSTTTFGTSPKTIVIPLTGLTGEDWPIIDVTGPVTALNVSHALPGDTILFSTAIPSGETFRIDLRPGYKTVRRTSDNANRLSYVNPSYIGAFSSLRIVSEKVIKSLNPSLSSQTLTFSGSGLSGVGSITVYWYQRYLSL